MCVVHDHLVWQSNNCDRHHRFGNVAIATMRIVQLHAVAGCSSVEDRESTSSWQGGDSMRLSD
jgi:hypothetical protein